MRSRIAAVAAVFAMAGPGALAPAVSADDVPDVFEATAISGGLHYEIAVPAFFEAFGPYALAEASNGQAHSLQAPLYLGFFLTAAAEQFGFPPPPGTTETLYPQGPTQAGTPPLPSDGNAFESSGRSGPDGASGRAIVLRQAQAPLYDVALGDAASSVDVTPDGVRSTATIRMDNIDVLEGLVTIDQVTGSAEAAATGSRGGGSADGSIAMTGVEVAGTRVDVTADGLVVAGNPVGAPSEAVEVAGVRIERLPTTRTVSEDGTLAEIHVGGFRFTFTQEQAEAQSSFTVGDLIARTRVVDLAVPRSVDVDGASERPAFRTVTRTVTDPGSGTTIEPPPADGSDRDVELRAVRRTVPASGADWVALAAAAALAAPAALIIRRVFRSAVRP